MVSARDVFDTILAWYDTTLNDTDLSLSLPKSKVHSLSVQKFVFTHSLFPTLWLLNVPCELNFVTELCYQHGIGIGGHDQ